LRTLGEILRGEADLGAFLLKCRLDFRFFGERVLGLDLQPYHLYWVKTFIEQEKSCLTAPRGSGKTHLMGISFSIWISIFKERKQFLIVAAGKDKAKDIITEVRTTIEDNELLDALLTPHKKSAAWSTQELRVKTGCRIFSRAYTGKGIRGQHVDYVLFDEGGEITGKETKLFFNAVSPTTKKKNGHIMVIGTPKSDVDLLSVLNEPERGYFCRTYSMWDEESQTSLWPGEFTKKKLDEIRNELGPLLFRQEYQCERIEEGVQPFNLSDVVRAYDKTLGFHNVAHFYKVFDETDLEKEPGLEKGLYFLGVDLAMAPEGDFSVYHLLEVRDGKLYIRRIQREQGIHYKVQEAAVKQLFDEFQPSRLLIDKSVFGEVFISDLREMGVPAEPFTFAPNNRNKILNNLVRLLENELVVIPRDVNDSECIRETTILTEELQKFQFAQTPSGERTYKSIGKHDDSVMAFALAAWAATENGIALDYAKVEVLDDILSPLQDNSDNGVPNYPEPVFGEFQPPPF